MKKTKLLFLLCLTFMLVALFSVSASAATDDGTGIFVGGIPVTEDNQQDILGDGSAKYDPTTRTLTVKDYSAEGVVRTDDGGEASSNALSIYIGIGSGSVNLIIEGDCYFSGGIVNAVGTILVKDANITFGPSVPTCIFTRSGTIEIVDSKVTMEGVNYISPIFSANEMAIGFFASEINMENSRFELKLEQCEATDLNRIDALFCAESNAVFENTNFHISTPFPVFRALFQSYKEALIFMNCRLKLAGQMYCFLAGGNPEAEGDIPESSSAGAVWMDGCRIKVKNSYYLMGGSVFQIKNSKVKASLYRDGAVMAADDENDQSIIQNSRVSLTLLSLEDMEKNIFRPYWDAMTEAEKSKYENYTAFANASKKNETDAPKDTFGIFIQNGTMFFEKSTILMDGFDYGFFAYGKVLAKTLGKVRLDIDAEHGAILMLSVYAEPFQYDVNMNFGLNAGSELALPQGTPNSVGATVYGIAREGERIVLAQDKVPESVAEVLSLLRGNQTEVRILSEGAFNPNVLTVALVAVGLVAVTAVIYIFFIRRPVSGEESVSE